MRPTVFGEVGHDIIDDSLALAETMANIRSHIFSFPCCTHSILICALTFYALPLLYVCRISTIPWTVSWFLAMSSQWLSERLRFNCPHLWHWPLDRSVRFLLPLCTFFRVSNSWAKLVFSLNDDLCYVLQCHWSVSILYAIVKLSGNWSSYLRIPSPRFGATTTKPTSFSAFIEPTTNHLQMSFPLFCWFRASYRLFILLHFLFSICYQLCLLVHRPSLPLHVSALQLQQQTFIVIQTTTYICVLWFWTRMKSDHHGSNAALVSVCWFCFQSFILLRSFTRSCTSCIVLRSSWHSYLVTTASEFWTNIEV